MAGNLRHDPLNLTGFRMTDAAITFPAAALAGVISFLSPCILPLAPPYLAYLAGTSIERLTDEGERRARRDVMIAAALFVAGFSTVFVALGAGAFAVMRVLAPIAPYFNAIAGIVLILMGLHFLGLVRIAALYGEKRVQVQKPAGLWSAYVMGLAFALGWTPCLGPILAGILLIAGSEDTAWRGAALLATYSAGLGAPFLLVAAAFGRALKTMGSLKRHMPTVEKIAGGFLVLAGLAFLTGGMQWASFWLLQTFPGFGKLG
jgi:cytochrome c-type biogenesis protein